MLEIRSARADELREAAQCIGMAFFQNHEDIDDVLESFRQSLVMDTIYDPENTRIVRVDGLILGVAQIANRKMLVGGEALPLGVILWVGTHPEYRRHGIGAMLLNDAVETLHARGYDLSLLFGEGKEPFYERAGWRSVQCLFKDQINLLGEISEPVFDGEIGPINWQNELDTVMDIFAMAQAGATGPAVRDRKFWMEYSARPAFDHPIFLVARIEGQVVAYLRSGYQRAILEAAMLPGAEDALLALILHACRAARKAGLAKIDSIEFPAWRYRLQSHGLAFERAPVRGQMYRVINLPSTLTHLQDVINERWLQDGPKNWHGNIRLRSNAGDAYLRIEHGSVHIQPSTPGHIQMDVVLTHQQMIDLIFGQVNHDLLRVEGSIPWQEGQNVLRALFPPQPFHWYPKDSF